MSDIREVITLWCNFLVRGSVKTGAIEDDDSPGPRNWQEWTRLSWECLSITGH